MIIHYQGYTLARADRRTIIVADEMGVLAELSSWDYAVRWIDAHEEKLQQMMDQIHAAWARRRGRLH